MKNWHLELREIEELIPHARNARTLTKDQAKHLSKSMIKFGVIDKPIINAGGQLIGGHQRVQVLKKLGETHVECWVCDDELTDEEIDELNIRLNKNTGDWDWDLLANQWDVNLLCEWGFTAKDFHDEGKGKLESNPKVTIEFSSQEDLDEVMPFIEEVSGNYDVKVKIKGS